MCLFVRALFIDREAREIMYMVVSVHPSVHNQSVYADNCADAVDRLLFSGGLWGYADVASSFLWAVQLYSESGR